MQPRPAALLVLALLLPASAQAASVARYIEPTDSAKIGMEFMGYWGMGFRAGFAPGTRILDSVNLRVGAALPFRFKEGLHVRHGMVPYDLDGEPGPLTPYLAPALDINLWGPLEVELTGGFAVIGVEQSTDLFPGFTAGAALRLDFETDVPVTFNAGALVMSDACWCSPRIVLDIGPRFAW